MENEIPVKIELLPSADRMSVIILLQALQPLSAEQVASLMDNFSKMLRSKISSIVKAPDLIKL